MLARNGGLGTNGGIRSDTVANPSYGERLEVELAALGITEDELNPEIVARLRAIPKATFEQLGCYFVPGAIYRTLARPSPSRGGVDAWKWVENGYSWVEIGEQFRRVFESDVTQ